MNLTWVNVQTTALERGTWKTLAAQCAEGRRRSSLSNMTQDTDVRRSVRPSVSLSRSGSVSKWIHIIVKLCTPSGRAIILVFWPEPAFQDYKGNPHNGVLNSEVGKLCVFNRYHRLPRKRYEIHPRLPLITNKNSFIPDQSESRWLDLDWHWKAGREGANYSSRSL